MMVYTKSNRLLCKTVYPVPDLVVRLVGTYKINGWDGFKVCPRTIKTSRR